MIKVAFIGSVGHQSLPFLGASESDDVEVVGVSTVTAEDDFTRLIEFFFTEKGRKEPKVYDNYLKLLDETKPDVVSVSPVYYKHSEVALECMSRGIHVYCEKPVAFDLETLAKMKEVCQKNNVHFTAMHNMRSMSHFQAGYKALQEGLIGRPILITGQKSYAFDNTRPEFYKKRETYGSTLCWVAIHAMDWTYWMAGGMSSIYAAHTTIGNRDYDECESSGVIAFSLKNGGQGCINFDFLKAYKDKVAQDRCRIAGEKGVIEIKQGKAFICTNDEELRELELVEQPNYFMGFLAQVQGKGTSLLSAEDAFEVTRLSLLARKSADENILINPDDYSL